MSGADYTPSSLLAAVDPAAGNAGAIANCAPMPWRVADYESCGGRNIVDANGHVIATVIQRYPNPVHGRGITQAECDMIAELMADAWRLP